MGLGHQWGLTVAIDVKAMRTFETSSKKLEVGAQRIAMVGQQANDTITKLGASFKNTADVITKTIKELEKAVDSAKDKLGSGGAGGGLRFNDMKHARAGGTFGAGGNATDTYMRKLLGLPKDLWEALAPKGKNKPLPLVGRFAEPTIDRGKRVYTPDQMHVNIMRGVVTAPIVKAIQTLDSHLTAVIRDLIQSNNALARDVIVQPPKRARSRNDESFYDDGSTSYSQASRAPPGRSGVPTNLGRSYVKVDRSDDLKKALSSSTPILGKGDFSLSNLRKQFLDALSHTFYAKSFNELDKTKFPSQKVQGLPMNAMPAFFADQKKLLPQEALNKFRQFWQSKAVKDLMDYMGSGLKEGSLYYQFNPANLKANLGATRKGGKPLSDAERAVNLGHVLEQLNQQGAKNLGVHSTGDLYTIFKRWDLQLRRIWNPLHTFLERSNTLNAVPDAPKTKRTRRRNAEAVNIDLPDESEVDGRTLPPPRRHLLDWRSDMQTPDKFRKKFDNALNWGSAAAVIYGGTTKVSEGIRDMTNYELAMNKIRATMNPMAADFYKLSAGAEKLGQTFGHSLGDVAQVMGTLTKQGFDVNQVIKETTTVLMAANTTEMTLTEATDGLIATQREFLLSTSNGMRVLDSWNSLERTTGVGANVLAEATKRAGTASRTAGIDFDSFNGIVAAVGETTRKSGDTIGTAMKYMFQHMRDVKAVESLQSVGVFSEDAAGNFKTAKQTLGELAGRWDKLTDAQRNNVALSVAGTEHLNDFIVMMETWDRSIDLSVVSMTSQGTTMKQNAIIMESLDKKVDQLKSSFQSLFAEMGQAGVLDIFKTMADSARMVVQMFGTVNKGTGGFTAGLLGTGALAAGGIGAATYFGGSILGPALFKPGRGEGDEGGIGGFLAKNRSIGRSTGRLTANSEFMDDEELASLVTPHKNFWNKGRLAGAGLIAGAGLLSAGYQQYGNSDLPGGPQSGRTTGVNILSQLMSTAGMVQMFGGFKGLAKSGLGGKGLLAGLVATGLMGAYGQYEKYKQGQQTDSGGKLSELQAWGEKVAQVKGDIRTVLRQANGGEAHADVDVTKVQAIKDAMATIDPSFASAAKSTQEFLKELQTYPAMLDDMTAKLRGQMGDIIGQVLDKNLSDPEVQKAAARLKELEGAQRTRNTGDSTDDRKARIARASEMSGLRDELNDKLLTPFRGEMRNAGMNGASVDKGAIDKIAEATGHNREDVARIALQERMYGAMKYRVDTDKQLNAAGVSAADVHYYQKENNGPVYDIDSNRAVDKKSVGNAFVLQTNASNALGEAAMTQAKNINHLVTEYDRAMDRLIAKNDDLMKNIESVNQSLSGMAFSSPDSILGGRQDLQNVQRVLQRLSDTNTKGVRDFAVPVLDNPKAVQNALLEMIGDVNLKAKSPFGVAPMGILNAMNNVMLTGNQFQGGLKSARDRLVNSGGDITEAGKGGDTDSNFNFKYLIETVGQDAAQQAAEFAKQAAVARGEGDTTTADRLIQKLDEYLQGSYKAGLNNSYNKRGDELRAAMGQQMQGTQLSVATLGAAFSRSMATGQSKNVSAFMKTPEAQAQQQLVDQIAASAGELVTTQKKVMERISKEQGTNSEDYHNAEEQLRGLQANFDNLSNVSKNLTERVKNVVVGMDALQSALTRMKAASGFGGAFGQTGAQGDQYAIEYLTKQLEKLGDELRGTNDPQKQANVNKQIDDLRGELVRRQTNVEATKDYRATLGQGLYTNVLSSRIQSAMGLQSENSTGDYVKELDQQFREFTQRIAKDFAPAMQGQGPDQIRKTLEQLKPMLSGLGGTIHDLQLDQNNDYRKQYLLASPSQRMAADAIKNQIKSGASAEEIFSDPYSRDLAKTNPLVDQLLNQALETTQQDRLIQFQENILDENKKAVDWLQKIYQDTINPARKNAGLVPATPGAGPFVVPGEKSRFAMGTMARSGSGNIDQQGRIKRDWTPAYLDKGEVVLDASQSSDYLARRNRFANGTIRAGDPTGRPDNDHDLLNYLYAEMYREQGAKNIGFIHGRVGNGYAALKGRFSRGISTASQSADSAADGYGFNIGDTVKFRDAKGVLRSGKYVSQGGGTVSIKVGAVTRRVDASMVEGMSGIAATLPRELAGAKPRYGFGKGKLFQLDFESDVDKALYITAGAKKSKADAAYRAFLKQAGFNDTNIDARGPQVRAKIKELARVGNPDEPLKIPSVFGRALATAQSNVPPAKMAAFQGTGSFWDQLIQSSKSATTPPAVAAAVANVVAKQVPHALTDDLMKQAVNEHRLNLYGSEHPHFVDLVRPGQEGGAAAGVKSLFDKARELAIKHASKNGIDPGVMSSILNNAQVKYDRMLHSNGSRGPNARWTSMDLTDTGNSLKIKTPDIIRMAHTAEIGGATEGGIASLLTHESQHMIDQLWSPEFYKVAPPEYQALAKRVQSRIMDMVMSDERPEALRAKRSAAWLYQGKIKDLSTGAGNRLHAYESRALMSEAGTHSPMGKQTNTILSEGLKQFYEDVKVGNSKPAWSNLSKSMAQVDALLQSNGYLSDNKYSVMRSAHGPSNADAYQRMLDEQNGVYSLAPDHGNNRISPIEALTKKSTGKRRNGDLFPTFRRYGRGIKSGIVMGRQGVNWVRGGGMGDAMASAKNRGLRMVEALKQGGGRFIENLGHVQSAERFGTTIPGTLSEAGIADHAPFWSREMFAPHSSGGFSASGGLKGIGVMALLAAAHSDKAQGVANNLGIGRGYNYALHGADAVFESQMAIAAMRGESLTGFNLLGGLASRGGMMSNAAGLARTAKMGVGKVLIPFEIANQVLNVGAGINRVGHDFGWINDRDYKKGTIGTENIGVAKGMLWSPFSQPGGFLYRHGANLINKARGKGYTSDAQKEQNFLMGGKDFLKSQGVNTFSQWDDDYVTAMKMKSAIDQGGYNRNLKQALGSPLLMLAPKDALDAAFKSVKPGGGGAGMTGDAALKAEYDNITQAIESMSTQNEAFKQMNAGLGNNGFGTGRSDELETRLAAMKNRQSYLKEMISGARSAGPMNWGNLEGLYSLLPAGTRGGLASQGVDSIFGKLMSDFGVNGSLGDVESIASSLVASRPSATLNDLVNQITGGNEQDVNRSKTNLLSFNQDLGAYVADPGKLQQLLATAHAKSPDLVKKLIAQAKNQDLGAAAAMAGDQFAKMQSVSAFQQSLVNLKNYDFSGYDTTFNQAKVAAESLRSDTNYSFGPNAKPEDIDAKLAIYNKRIEGVRSLQSNLQQRWGQMQSLASVAQSSFDAFQAKRGGKSESIWHILGMQMPNSPDALGGTMSSLNGFVSQAQASRQKWVDAISAKNDAAQSQTYLSHLTNRPMLERVRQAARDHMTGALTGGFETKARVKGDDKWRYGADAKKLAADMPKLVSIYNTAQNKSVLMMGMMNRFGKGMSKDKHLGQGELLKRLTGHGDANDAFVSAALRYSTLQKKLEGAKATSQETDPDAQRKIAELTSQRDNVILDSGFSPQAFQRFTDMQAAIQQELGRRAAEQEAANARENAARKQAVSEYQNADTSPVFRPKRHTGGSVTASNEYVLQDTEGLVMTGSRMEKAVGLLSQMASNSGNGHGDDLSSLAGAFMGRTPEEGVLFHQHEGNVNVTLNGEDSMYAKIASAVADLIGKKSNVPTSGMRIPRAFEGR